MSLLDALKRVFRHRPDATTSVQEKSRAMTLESPVGNTEPVCPHCELSLEKMPARKKRCPRCGKYIYVRTRPADRVKVLVTEEQAAVIEQQWGIHCDEQENARLRSLPGFEQARTQLVQSLRREPTEHEVVLELANRDLALHGERRNWGLYRNAKLQIAESLRRLGKTKASLTAYLEVCYLDVNGPENVGAINDPELLTECPPFRPDTAQLARGLLWEVETMRQGLKLNPNQLRGAFLSAAANDHRSLNLPVSPEEAWRKLSQELSAGDVSDEATMTARGH